MIKKSTFSLLIFFAISILCLGAMSRTGGNYFPSNQQDYFLDKDPRINHAIDVIYGTYGDVVSIDLKKKDLLKFGKHTSVGTGWETMMELQDSETNETFVSGNTITSVVSTSGSDTGTMTYEYHTISDGVITFGVGSFTLNGQTAVTLPVAAFRANRAYNTGSSALVGDVAFYEGGSITSGKPDSDSTVHLLITGTDGNNQTEKAQTAISDDDYWIITNISLSILSKVSAYAEARIEAKPVSATYWRPISQTFACSDASGTIELLKEPYIIVPSNYDVRLACRANTGSVDMAGAFSGYLAIVVE